MRDAICEECSNSSGKTSKANLENQSVLKPPMQLRIFLRRSDFNFNYKKNKFCNNKTKTALPAQYSMSFPNNSEVIYIIVYINLHIGNDTDKGQYVCDVLDYNTGTWWNCDDETITQYPGYPMNVYNDLSIYKQQKRGKQRSMYGSDRIVSML